MISERKIKAADDGSGTAESIDTTKPKSHHCFGPIFAPPAEHVIQICMKLYIMAEDFRLPGGAFRLERLELLIRAHRNLS